MTKKPEVKKAKTAKTVEPKPDPKPKVHTSKPSSNPFTQAHPGRPGRSANGGTPGSKRGG